MPITRPPLPYPSEEVKTRLALDPTLAWLRRIAQARRVGLGAVIRDIVEHERARDMRRPAHKQLAAVPARDPQTPASSSTPATGAGETSHAPVSQQGGDDTSTPADSIRDEADPGGQSYEAAHTTQPGPGEAGVSQGGESEVTPPTGYEDN